MAAMAHILLTAQSLGCLRAHYWAFYCRIERPILVFLLAMLLRHRTIATLVAVGAAFALPAAAHASITEIGALPSPLPKFPCPGVDNAGTADDHPCKALSVTTTFQTK